jgi:hypothetical protein
MAKQKDRRKESGKIGLWTMIRDVLIASLNRGQFPFAAVCGIFVVMLVKMPSEDVSKLVFGLFDDLKRGWYIGYVLSAGLAIGWLKHSRWQRRIINDEMQRIGQEKTVLQEKLVGKTLPSSVG